MRQNIHKRKGFTLLELLLVVGVATLLIIAGITVYSLVNRSVKINETLRIIHLLLSETRHLYAGQPDFGPLGTNLEPFLAHSGRLPQKYIMNNDIITPFNITGGGIVFLATVDKQMSLDMALPPAFTPEIAAQFDPNTHNEVSFLRVCGVAISKGDAMPDVGTLSNACGNGTNSAALNFTLVTQ